MKKFQAKNSNKKFVCTANVSPKGEISGLTCQAAQEKPIARTEKHLVKAGAADNWLDMVSDDIKAQYAAYQETITKKTALTSKLNVASKHHHHSSSSSSSHSHSRHCSNDKKSFVGKWNIAVPQKIEWLPAQIATFSSSGLMILPSEFFVELGIFMSIEYYTESGDVYGYIVGDGFHITSISPDGPIVGKINHEGKKLMLSGSLNNDFLDLCNFLWFLAGSTKSGLPISNFLLELKLDGDKLKGITNFNPDNANVVGHCHGKRIDYNTSAKGPSVLGQPEVLIGPNTRDLSKFYDGTGWLGYTPFNSIADSWEVIPGSNPAQSAEIVTIHGPLFNGFGNSLFTKKKYDNFKLTFELYMSGDGVNSGLYLRDAWELQLFCCNSNGDIYSMNPALNAYFPVAGTDPDDDTQWTFVEVTLIDQTVTCYMQGVLVQQNTIPSHGNAIWTDSQKTDRSFQNDSHSIGLQNHTGDVRFRNMVITPIISLCDD
jgi:hypothetical protein